MTDVAPYAMVVFWSEEDGAWVADAPDLATCSVFGATPEEALSELRVAMEAWLAVAAENGLPAPPARFASKPAAA